MSFQCTTARLSTYLGEIYNILKALVHTMTFTFLAHWSNRNKQVRVRIWPVMRVKTLHLDSSGIHKLLILSILHTLWFHYELHMLRLNLYPIKKSLREMSRLFQLIVSFRWFNYELIRLMLIQFFLEGTEVSHKPKGLWCQLSNHRCASTSFLWRFTPLTWR